MKYIGLLSSAASGKLGGIVASHNRGGTYFRHHAVPVQPRTPAQTLVRNQLQGFSSAFKSLTQAQIAGWNALALTVTLKSKLGTTYNPTGQQLFVSCNKHLAAINITALLSNAPTIPSIPGFTSFTVATTSSYGYTTAITGTYTPSPSASFGIELRASSVLSAGRTFVGKSQFRTLAGYNPATGLTTDLLTPFLAKFGPLPSSGMIAYELRYIDPATGFAGAPIRATVSFQQTPVGSLFSLSAASLAGSLSAGTPLQKVALCHAHRSRHVRGRNPVEHHRDAYRRHGDNRHEPRRHVPCHQPDWLGGGDHRHLHGPACRHLWQLRHVHAVHPDRRSLVPCSTSASRVRSAAASWADSWEREQTPMTDKEPIPCATPDSSHLPRAAKQAAS